MMTGFYVLHRFYTVDDAKKRADEIMKEWEKKGWTKTNDVPPCDKNISEFLQLMRGLGHPIVDYKYKEKLKEVV